jgi:hopanoid C-2 methylase
MKTKMYSKYAHSPRLKKILIINCYFPEKRYPKKYTNEIPNTLAPVFLAGAFSSETCDIRLYNELNSGFLEIYHPELIEFPDMVVFTGLTFAD